MNRRYREILNTILNIDGCTTGREIAKQCNVSIRTIREDIKGINELLAEYGIKIESVLKKGYCLTEGNKRILKENNLIKKVLDSEYITAMPTSPKDRQMYILSKLTSREYLFVDELAEALCVSQSTISNDVMLVKKWLKTKLKLEIHWSLNDGIRLKADEREKRNIISRILAARLNASNNSKYWQYVFGEGEEGIAESTAALYHIVKAATNENGYCLSGHSSQLFCLEILVAANRHQSGFTIQAVDKNEASISPVMNGIRSAAEAYLSIRLPDEEWLYLQRCFEAKQFLYGTKLENLISQETVNIVDEFLRVMEDQFHIKLNSNKEAREKLLLYVGPMLKRIRFRQCIANPISENSIQSQQQEQAMAKEMGNIIKTELHLDADSIEIAYLTVHMESMSKLWKQKLRTAVVCDYDESIISLIMETVETHFGDRISICGSYTYQDFMFGDEESLQEIDFVISTSTIAAITDKPFVKINPVMKTKDIDSISESLDKHTFFRESGK